MSISEAIAKRKSIRAYLDQPIPEEDLARIVEAGRWAPNAGEFQITVIRNPGLRRKINDRTHEAMLHSGVEFLQQRASLPGYRPLYGAPVLILLSGPEDHPYSGFNTALAAENMLLEATELGLGSCFLVSPTLALKGEENRNLAREAGIPEGYSLQCALVVGYTRDEEEFSLGERTRRGVLHFID